MPIEKRSLASAFMLSALLAACGGSGGDGGCVGAACVISGTSRPPTTNASGAVVDDMSGDAIVGANVAVEPWTAGATPLPSPQATTDATGHFTLSGVPNGRYLLIIGSNLATDTTYTTVHDDVALVGGDQTLFAPRFPSMPGYTAPRWEKNGAYRISHIDATTELPCFQRFNADRATASQPAVPLDEWATENVRTINANQLSSQPIAAQYISSQNTVASNGKSGCNYLVDGAFTPTSAYGNDARVAWVGAQYEFGASSYFGTLEAPFDPRGTVDPNYPVWP